MIQPRTLSAGWLLVGALGCGEGTTSAGGNSARGSVDGVSLPVASGFAFVGPSMLSGCYGQTCDPFGDTVEVVLTSAAGFTCSFVASQENATFANGAALTLEVGNAKPVGPGTYAIDTALGAGDWRQHHADDGEREPRRRQLHGHLCARDARGLLRRRRVLAGRCVDRNRGRRRAPVRAVVAGGGAHASGQCFLLGRRFHPEWMRPSSYM
jgi:hypothetical protein